MIQALWQNAVGEFLWRALRVTVMIAGDLGPVQGRRFAVDVAAGRLSRCITGLIVKREKQGISCGSKFVGCVKVVAPHQFSQSQRGMWSNPALSFALSHTFLCIHSLQSLGRCLSKVCRCGFGGGFLLGSGTLSVKRVGLKFPFAFLRDLSVAAGRRRCLGFHAIGSTRRVRVLVFRGVERPKLGLEAANGCQPTRRVVRNGHLVVKSLQPTCTRLWRRNRPITAAVCTGLMYCRSRKRSAEMERTEVRAGATRRATRTWRVRHSRCSCLHEWAYQAYGR